MTAVESDYLFVFGTLKTGFPNANYNQADKVQGHFQTVNPYPLYLVDERYSPWLINSPGQGFRVSGEVYRSDEATLSIMDSLERIDQPDGYRRQQIDIENHQNGEKMLVWAYMKPIEHLKNATIMSGPMDQYTLEQAQLYQSRDNVR